MPTESWHSPAMSANMAFERFEIKGWNGTCPQPCTGFYQHRPDPDHRFPQQAFAVPLASLELAEVDCCRSAWNLESPEPLRA